MTTTLPIFETERLLLKPVEEAHAESCQKHFADYDVIQNLSPPVPWPYPEGGALDYIKNTILPNQGIDRWSWGIFLKDNPDELIGMIDLTREGDPDHRGFWLGKPFWGNGYMTEALEPIMDYAFSDLGFETMIFSNALGNKRSRRIKEKTGATFLKISPHQFINPDFKEQELWEMTKDNWLDFRKTNQTL